MFHGSLLTLLMMKCRQRKGCLDSLRPWAPMQKSRLYQKSLKVDKGEKNNLISAAILYKTDAKANNLFNQNKETEWTLSKKGRFRVTLFRVAIFFRGLKPSFQEGNGRHRILLHWTPAHVNIKGKECASVSAKEARDHGQTCTTITLADANAVASLV
ncbi:hypothetical protein TNCV_1218821 [Trichonephila clavipes]|nr:hypothetical protein TNCV_1218821 [Trichonephila clavipes]